LAESWVKKEYTRKNDLAGWHDGEMAEKMAGNGPKSINKITQKCTKNAI
jgi:hypothetical protein